MRKFIKYFKSFSWRELFLMLATFVGIIGSFAIYNTYNAQYPHWWKIQELRLKKNLATNPKAKANIAFIVPNLQRVGATIMYVRLISLLKEHNYNVAVFYNDAAIMKEDFQKLNVPIFKAPLSPLNYNKYISMLQNNFDICLTSGEQILYTQFVISRKMPTIWWLQEVDILLDEFADKTAAGNIVVKPESELYKDELWYFDPVYAIYKADIVAVSNLVRDALQGVPEKPAVVINNGVSLAELAESKRKSTTKLYQKLQRQNQDKMTFIYVGRVVEGKGVHVLLEAFDSLPAEYKKRSMLYIIGANNNIYANNLLTKYPATDNLIWTGEQKQDTLWDYYKAADMMIVPSVKNDAAPCVVTEAAMYKMPSIITTKTGSDYLVVDAKSGFIIPYDDAKVLKEKLMWAIDNPQKIKQMGQEAYQNFINTSTPQVFWQKWERKIKQKLQESKDLQQVQTKS